MRKYSDEEMLFILMRLADQNLVLSRRDYENRKAHSDPHVHLYESRFGTWGRALELAGLVPTEQPEQLQGITTRWSLDDLVDAIRCCLHDTGRSSILAYEAWRTDPQHPQPEMPSASTIRFRFGSWSAATALACQ